MKGLQKHLVKIFWNVGGKRIAQQAAQKAIGKAIPVVGAVAAFGMDWHSLQQKGKLAIQYYESGIPVVINSLATTKPPKLELVSEGAKPNKSIIYIRGFLTGHHREEDDWIHEIRMSGWFGNIYRFYWDSGDIGIFDKHQSSGEVTDFLMPIKWRKHRQNSKLMGLYYLPELVRDSDLFNADSITFVTHSLGTDLLQYALHTWPSNHSLERDLPRIERCVLMGGVSPSQYSLWLEFLNKFACSFSYKQKPTFLLNLNNKIDNHLLLELSVGDGFSNLKSVGLCEIELFSPHLKNIDCSEFIGSKHEGLAYLSVLAHYKSLQEPVKPKRRKRKPSKSKDPNPVATLESSNSTNATKKKHVNSLWDSFCQKSHKIFVWLFTPT